MSRTKPAQLDLPLRFRQQQPVARAHLALEGRLVSYTIKRSVRRRAISILVDEDGLRVGAPWHATQSAIDRLLRAHAAWVLRKLDEWRVHRLPGDALADGARVMLLGEPFTLKITPEDAPIGVRGAELLVGPAGIGANAAPARRIHEWLRNQALRCFEERVGHYRALLEISSETRVFLSSARTRWGSCHVSGRIHLNWRLVQMPPRLIDYVVAHEVAHLIEMNHSKRFWSAVARVMPDYAARRKELRSEGHRYLLI
jgi:predicted metal-dependent hydrolase